MDLKQFDFALNRLFQRREFIDLLAKAGAGSAVGLSVMSLSACGGGGGGSRGDDDNDDIPAPAIPVPTSEFTVLKRTSFGVSQSSMEQIESLGIADFLEQQLDPDSIDDGDLEATIASLFPLSQQGAPDLLAGFPDNIGDVARQMASATQYRQMFSQRQLHEVMVEFWSDHFTIHLLNGLGPTLKPIDDRDVIREHALGNFSDLLHASAKSAAMLFYLDNYNNISTAPNENYARELMELHTLGVDGGYTENDIKEVARCFTGWSLTFPGDPQGYGEFIFRSEWHDDDQKQVLSNIISAGGGQSDGEQILDLLVSHPSTASFIATKLCRRFISDAPDDSDVSAVANAFTKSDGDIKTTLRALFSLDSFRNNADQKITRPSEYLAQIVRALLPQLSYPTDDGELFYFAQSLMGHLPFFWSTPDGYPDVQSYWASTSGLLNRWRLSFLSYAGQLANLDMFSVDYDQLIAGASNITELVDALAESILMRPLLSTDRQYLIDRVAEALSISVDTDLGAAATEVAPLIAAIFISSAYFQLR
ncbi:MAG: DUF1800 domain-containing protein [Pseudomonadales bacterium]|nr:DUF1800 domain-containing protein [Pseudomonadales bacterium]